MKKNNVMIGLRWIVDHAYLLVKLLNIQVSKTHAGKEQIILTIKKTLPYCPNVNFKHLKNRRIAQSIAHALELRKVTVSTFHRSEFLTSKSSLHQGASVPVELERSPRDLFRHLTANLGTHLFRLARQKLNFDMQNASRPQRWRPNNKEAFLLKALMVKPDSLKSVSFTLQVWSSDKIVL